MTTGHQEGQKRLEIGCFLNNQNYLEIVRD